MESTDRTRMKAGHDSDVQAGELRDHLANTRTFLAWVRTAVTIMAFGFVVARFGILLRELPGRHHNVGYHLSDVIGTVLVLLGAVFLLLSTREFLTVRRAISNQEIEVRPNLYLLLAGCVVVVALVLAVYLLLTG